MDKKAIAVVIVAVVAMALAAAWIGISNKSVAVQAPENNEATLSCQTVPDPPVIYGVAPTGTQAEFNTWEEKYGAEYKTCKEAGLSYQKTYGPK